MLIRRNEKRRFSLLNKIQENLWRDQSGSVLSVELILIGVVLAFGLMVALTAVRDSVISEISDVSGGVQDINQTFLVNGVSQGSSGTAGFGFADALDVGDSPDDVAGTADNGISFDGLPIEELGLPFSSSAISSPTDIVVDTGRGGTATGTIGDGTIDTMFEITTDTGNISGMVGNEVRFRESPGTAGEFTITFDDPIADLELWIRNLVTNGGPNLLGNFTIELNDGRVIDNAAFTIIPDVIVRNSSFGEFNTLSTDRELLSKVSVGGLDYVVDPTDNGNTTQAAGRITFDDLPAFSGDANVNTIGISSIKFYRSGGRPGSQAALSFSGRAIVPD